MWVVKQPLDRVGREAREVLEPVGANVPVGLDAAETVDRDLLLSAVGNLLQNAFKFTHLGSEVRLQASWSAGRVLVWAAGPEAAPKLDRAPTLVASSR